ncbi:MAG: hypothetical protein OXH09_19315 [Gammaproteobacteria bacterium]|nr:hypothetical protein [Gammaproteobacteria bacterium]
MIKLGGTPSGLTVKVTGSAHSLSSPVTLTNPSSFSAGDNTFTAPAETSLRVGWRAPGYDGNSAVTDYDVRHREAYAAIWTEIGDTTDSTATHTTLEALGRPCRRTWNTPSSCWGCRPGRPSRWPPPHWEPASTPTRKPTIELVRVVSRPTHDADGVFDTYAAGDRILVDVEMSEPVEVEEGTGRVYLSLDVGADDADFSNSEEQAGLDGVLHGGRTLRFGYAVSVLDADADGIRTQRHLPKVAWSTRGGVPVPHRGHRCGRIKGWFKQRMTGLPSNARH